MPKCPHCGKEFSTERGLKVHIARVHGKASQEAGKKK